jgi:hypothetical protein
MKTFILATFVLALSAIQKQAISQTPNWLWAKDVAASSTTSQASGYPLCIDQNGNSFLAGNTIGPFAVGSSTFNNPGGAASLIKYDPNGNPLWALTYTESANPTGLACDYAGNLFLAGRYNTSLIIGSNTLTTINNSSGVLLVKYDNNGNVLWVRTAGGSGVGGGASMEIAYSVNTDAQGNCIITGIYTTPTIVFGAYTLTTPAYQCMFFVTKYDPNGNVLWATNGQSGGTAHTNYVCTDKNSNVFIAGKFEGTLVMGSNTLASAGGFDFFAAKLNPAGSVLWATSGGGSSGEEACCVNADPLGNVYVTGSFFSPNISIGPNTFSNAGGLDVFIAKYTNNGSLIWARREGGTGYDKGFSLASRSGDVFLAGSLGETGMTIGTVALPSGTVYSTNSSCVVNDAMFLVRYDQAGNPVYVTSLKGGGDNLMTLCLDNFCDLHIGGDYVIPSFSIGSTTLLNNNLNGSKLFLNKIDLGNPPPVTVAGNFTICPGQSTTLFAGGANTYVWNTGGQSSSITITPSVTQSYWVIGTNTTSGCFTSEEVLIKVSECAGLSSEEKGDLFSIFPNPTPGKIRIGNAPELHANIFVCNTLGEIVFFAEKNNLTEEVDISALPPGVYFVHLESSSGNQVVKVLKE